MTEHEENIKAIRYILLTFIIILIAIGLSWTNFNAILATIIILVLLAIGLFIIDYN